MPGHRGVETRAKIHGIVTVLMAQIALRIWAAALIRLPEGHL
jgi:hypothetical protein